MKSNYKRLGDYIQEVNDRDTDLTVDLLLGEIGLHKTERQIERFEKEYNVSSDIFQRDFAAEDMKKGDLEYIEWAGELKVREKILKD